MLLLLLTAIDKLLTFFSREEFQAVDLDAATLCTDSLSAPQVSKGQGAQDELMTWTRFRSVT